MLPGVLTDCRIRPVLECGDNKTVHQDGTLQHSEPLQGLSQDAAATRTKDSVDVTPPALVTLTWTAPDCCCKLSTSSLPNLSRSQPAQSHESRHASSASIDSQARQIHAPGIRAVRLPVELHHIARRPPSIQPQAPTLAQQPPLRSGRLRRRHHVSFQRHRRYGHGAHACVFPGSQLSIGHSILMVKQGAVATMTMPTPKVRQPSACDDRFENSLLTEDRG